MERKAHEARDYVAELSFDKEDGLFHARVMNLERDSLDFCASSIDELHQESASAAASRRGRGRSANNS